MKMSRVRSTARFRLPTALLATCAVLGAFFVVPAIASAHEWKIEGKTLNERGLASETVSSSGGPFNLRTTIGGSPVRILCSTETNTGTIVKGGTDTATVTFSGCSLYVTEGGSEKLVTTCTVPTIKTEVLTELVTVGTTLYDKFIPKAGATGTFVTVKIEGECAQAGKYAVKGATVGFDNEAGIEKKTHTLQFSEALSKAAGVALTFGANPASLEGSSGETLSGTAWANKLWSAS